jgi:signal transduction histidine kinase
MNIDAAIPLAAGLTGCSLAATFFIAGGASRIHRPLALFCSSLALWNLSQFMLVGGWLGGWQALWRAGLSAGFVLTPATMTHFCFEATGGPKPGLTAWIYGVYAMAALLGVGGAFLKTIAMSGRNAWVAPGPAAPLLPWLLLVPAGAVAALWRGRREFGPATVLTLPLGLLAALMLRDAILLAAAPAGIPAPAAFGLWPSAATALAGLFLMFGLLRGGWFELKLNRPVWVFRFLGGSLCFVVAELLLSSASSRIAPGAGFEGEAATLLLAATGASLALLAAAGGASGGAGRAPAAEEISGSARQADQMRRFLQAAAEAPDAGAIKEQLRGFLAGVMRARRFQLYLRDEPGLEFALFDSHPPSPPGPGGALRMDAPVIRAFLGERPDYLRLPKEPDSEIRSELQSAARLQMRGWGAEWCFPLFSGPDLLGALALAGEAGKPSYDAEEVKLMVHFSRNLAVLAHKLSLTDELELIGRMSRGMAHDLKDLLTPLKTLVQLMEEEGGARPRLRELLPVAARNLDALQAYVDEALFFSRNRAPSIRPARLDHILQQAVRLAEPRSGKKGVRVLLAPLTAHSAEVDETLIQRMVSNVLSNAIDASEPKAQVEIELQSLHKEPDSPPWARVRVLDWGSGMSEESVQKLLRGRFTTKPGRGSGLGFAIARKIALLHGGQISVFSEENVGTCVEIDLPGRSRWPAPAAAGAEPAPASPTQKEYR